MSQPGAMTRRMAQVRPAISRSGPTLRMVGAVAVAAAVLLVPGLVWTVVKPEAHSVEYGVLGLLVFVACPLVFQLLSRPNPGLRYGAIFAFVVAVPFAVLIATGIHPGPLTVSAGFLAAIAVFFVVFIPGLIGAFIGLLIADGLDSERQTKHFSRLRSWHLGAAVAVIELVATVLLPVLWR